MKIAICYTSLTGNTEKIAQGIRSVFSKECCYFGTPSLKALEADFIFLGFWNRHSRAEEEMTAFFKKMKGRRVACFMTLGSGNPQYWERSWENIKEDLPEEVELMGTYTCQGRMRTSVLEKYEAYKLEGRPGAEARIRNYCEALKHPNETDVE